MNLPTIALPIALLTVLASGARATDFPESEPNDAKAWATHVLDMSAGDTLSGVSTGDYTLGLDYFRIRLATLSPGIYRHRLIISSNTPGGDVGAAIDDAVALRKAADRAGVPGRAVIILAVVLDRLSASLSERRLAGG